MPGRRAWLVAVRSRPTAEEETIDQAVGLYYYPEPRYKEVVKVHAALVAMALRLLKRRVDVVGIVTNIAPVRLMRLSYDLPVKQGEDLREYIAALEEWQQRYLADLDEFRRGRQ
jgi:hypothetical protein